MTAMQSKKKKMARLSYSSPYSTITQTQMMRMTHNNATTHHKWDHNFSLWLIFISVYHHKSQSDDHKNHNDEEISDDEVTVSGHNEVSKREGSENSENNQRDQRTDVRVSGAARDALDILADLAAERLL